jgi:hypothetical protein
MNVEWMALLQVTLATIASAVAVVGLMSLANWCLTPAHETYELDTIPLPRRLAGYAAIGLMGLIILAALVLIAKDHVARLLGLG